MERVKIAKIIFTFGLLLTLFSCSKEAIRDTFEVGDALLITQGTFVSAAHPTSGTVKVYERVNTGYLVVENFRTDTGPDLKVYLSSDLAASSFTNLGKLPTTNGDFYFELPEGVDITEKNKVLIWCKAFSVLFGSAQLE